MTPVLIDSVSDPDADPVSTYHPDANPDGDLFTPALFIFSTFCAS
jgi:hypothetical protein